MKWIHLIIVVLFFVSCKTSQNTLQSNNSNEDTDANKIIFINYKLYHDSITHTDSIVLVNQIITAGKLKTTTENKKETEIGDLICTFGDNQKQLLKEIIIENPLEKRVEYATNDFQLATQTVHLNEASFFIRVQLEPEMKYISIRKVVAQGEIDHHVLHQTKIDKK